ncbi:nucleotide exchange factor GrpE [Thermoanaerobacterium sp. RBIITD]|uniref:nucleotide exchange factor GrpE n=1 Tax=Thermoanaerobacterium sp. RBIITD TaxID=1550240 RepID=UPI000BB6CAC2|nr:nucleotide exchange factor GrpE [Thermoanaerobacterium sp. RBIITD]SNX55236.1 molecular chaperone GrpE [Thermoanaerobacterium sp. RBIITD]
MENEKDTIKQENNEEDLSTNTPVQDENISNIIINDAEEDDKQRDFDKQNEEKDLKKEEEKENSISEGEIEELKKILKRKEEEANEYLALAQRLKAEFENYRKRTEKEKGDLVEYGKEKVLTQILPVIDNFERALASQASDSTSFKEGVELIYRQFKDVLEKTGVKEIDALGQIFDPYKHHAVMQEEVEGKKENEIIEVLQKGYTFNNKVIRPSMVKVAK